MISEKMIASISSNPHLLANGMGRLMRPSTSHQKIIDALTEVSTKLKISNPNLLIHDGETDATGYYHSQDCLIMPEKLQVILTENELKALIAHELDHVVKVSGGRKMEEMQLLLDSVEAPEAKRALKTISRFGNYLEISADARAAELYGAENMKNALITLFSFSNDPLAKVNIMGIGIARNASPEDITRKLRDVAAGRSTTSIPEIDKRLRFLENREKSYPTAAHQR